MINAFETREIKIERRIKLNHNIYISLHSQIRLSTCMVEFRLNCAVSQSEEYQANTHADTS